MISLVIDQSLYKQLPLFRCASISWFEVVSGSVINIFLRLAHLRVFQSYFVFSISNSKRLLHEKSILYVQISCRFAWYIHTRCTDFIAESGVSCNDICGSNFHVIGYISVFWPKGLFYASNFISFICAAMLYVAATLIAFPSFLLGTAQPARTQSGAPTTSQHGVRAFSSCF